MFTNPISLDNYILSRMQNPGVSDDHGPNLVAFVQMSIFGKKATMLVASSYLPRGCVRP